MRQHGEPSVEEILGSIKRVIARDNKVVPIASRLSVEDVEDDVLDLASAQFLGGIDEAQAPLTSETARDSMRDSLAALSMIAKAGAKPEARSTDSSLESMVRDLLRPALTEWLDRHLPAIVERLVAEEIARIMGKNAKP
jgi:cell pole-organizing protein PopZ